MTHEWRVRACLLGCFMFDAVMATAGAPRRGSSKGASPGSVCVKGCVASDAINSLDAIPANIDILISDKNPGCLDWCAHCWCVGVWHRV